MKTVTINTVNLKLSLALIIMLSIFTINKTSASNSNSLEISTQLPSFLVGTYNGNLMTNNTMTTKGSCTISSRRNSNYTLKFNNGIQSIRNVKFRKDDDTYTSSFIYKGKTFAAVVDEDGDLAINATSGYSNVLSFSGEISIRRGNSHNNTTVVSNNGNQHIETNNNDDVFIQNGNQTIHTNNHGNNTEINNGNQTIETDHDDVYIQNGNQTIHTNNNGTSINNGNVSISTDGNGVNINGSISIGQNHNEPIIIHESNPEYYYECGSYEIVQLPRNAIGFYKGRLNGFNRNTRKGICKIVETGCKTYRLDFSDNLPSIHGVQFGRMNDFDEYTSVIIQGQYSAAIEIDMGFSDLSIDGEILAIDFDGDKQ